jgi:hypothetical protein
MIKPVKINEIIYKNIWRMIDGPSHQLCHLEREKKDSENEILIERKMMVV